MDSRLGSRPFCTLPSYTRVILFAALAHDIPLFLFLFGKECNYSSSANVVYVVVCAAEISTLLRTAPSFASVGLFMKRTRTLPLSGQHSFGVCLEMPVSHFAHIRAAAVNDRRQSNSAIHPSERRRRLRRWWRRDATTVNDSKIDVKDSDRVRSGERHHFTM